jgi:hypothetical protein
MLHRDLQCARNHIVSWTSSEGENEPTTSVNAVGCDCVHVPVQALYHLRTRSAAAHLLPVTDDVLLREGHLEQGYDVGEVWRVRRDVPMHDRPTDAMVARSSAHAPK